MTSAEVAQLAAAAIALIGALTAYLHARTTRQALRAHLNLHHLSSISTVRQRKGDGEDGGQAGTAAGTR